ncbi:MAG: hypothetical protein ABL970_05045 [Nitrospira sp.]
MARFVVGGEVSEHPFCGGGRKGHYRDVKSKVWQSGTCGEMVPDTIVFLWYPALAHLSGVSPAAFEAVSK